MAVFVLVFAFEVLKTTAASDRCLVEDVEGPTYIEDYFAAGFQGFD